MRAITSIVKSDSSGKYYAKMENDQLVDIIERAHLMQYDRDVKGSQVYAGQKNYTACCRTFAMITVNRSS